MRGSSMRSSTRWKRSATPRSERTHTCKTATTEGLTTSFVKCSSLVQSLGARKHGKTISMIQRAGTKVY